MSFDTARAIATTRGLTRRFDAAFNEATPIYSRFCQVSPSQGADEKYGFLAAVPSMREWLAGREAIRLTGGEFELVNKLYEVSIEIEKTDFEDDRVGLYAPKFAEAGLNARMHPDELLIDLIIRGVNNICFDGATFYSNGHKWVSDGASQSNNITADCANVDSITNVEFRAAVRKAVTTMLGFTDSRERKIHRTAVNRLNDLAIMVPLELRDVANEAFGAAIIENTSNVVIDRPDIYTVPSFDDATIFRIFATNGNSSKPFVFQPRRDLITGLIGLEDRERKAFLWGGDARYAMGYGAWWNSVQVTMQD